jgi:hypothetical protein
MSEIDSAPEAPGTPGTAEAPALSKRERARERERRRAARAQQPRRPTAPDGLLVVDKPHACATWPAPARSGTRAPWTRWPPACW